MIKPVILILFSICLSVFGQINLKQGMLNVNKHISQTEPVNNNPPVNSPSVKINKIITLLINAFLNPRIIIGIGCYVLGMVLWLIVLSRVDLSFAYPLLGMSYILVVLSASVILKEDVSLQRWLGTLVIFLGVVIVARS